MLLDDLSIDDELLDELDDDDFSIEDELLDELDSSTGVYGFQNVDSVIGPFAVPSLALPLLSLATVPLPSLSFHRMSRPVGSGTFVIRVSISAGVFAIL